MVHVPIRNKNILDLILTTLPGQFPDVYPPDKIYLLDNIYIRFGTKLYRQIVGIPMGTNCAPLVADLFLFCYERDFMTSLSDVKQAEIIEAFKSTSRYLDDL